MKKQKGLTAPLLKYILFSVLFLSLVAFGGVFYVAQGILRDLAVQTSTLNSEASISDDNLVSLSKTKEYLEQHSEQVDRAARVVAESKQYQYQDEIINDLASFAKKSGVSITGYVFDTGQGAGSSSGSSSTTKLKSNSLTVSGLKTVTVQVSLDNPVNYNKLLRFISLIEQNTTKMQISSISLSRNTEGDKNAVTSDSFNIMVYTR